MLIGWIVEAALSGVGLAVWRWLAVGGYMQYRVVVPKVDDALPITLDSDYRGLVL